MSAFKDYLKSDVKTVFLNPEEFGEEHDVNGKTVVCLIDTDELDQASIYSDARRLEGVFSDTKTLYVALEDLGKIPVRGQILSIDGSLHLVRSVSDEHGMLAVKIEEHEQ